MQIRNITTIRYIFFFFFSGMFQVVHNEIHYICFVTLFRHKYTCSYIFLNNSILFGLTYLDESSNVRLYLVNRVNLSLSKISDSVFL